MIKRIKTNIIQRPLTTTLNIVLFIVLSSFVFFSLIIYNSAIELQENMLKQLGASISISPNSGYNISLKGERDRLGEKYDESIYFPPLIQENLNSILAIDEVAGIESLNSDSMLFALPANFKNSKSYTGSNPYAQKHKTGDIKEQDIELYSNSINIVGCTDIEMFEYFRRNLSVITAGEYPSNENPGALISSELANENNLNVGDMLEIKSISSSFDKNTSLRTTNIDEVTDEIKIVGIYSTNLYFNISDDNYQSIEIFKSSPYNTIFTDYTTAISLNNKNHEIRFFDIYLNSPKDIENVMQELKAVPLDWEKYQALDVNQTFHSDLIDQTDNFILRTLILLLVSVAVGIILFVLFIMTFNNNNEISILMLLGEHKHKIIFGKTIEYLCYSIMALPLTLFIGYKLAYLLQDALSPKVIEQTLTMLSFSIGSDNYIPKLDLIVTPENITLAILYIIFLLIVSSIMITYNVYKMNLKNMIIKAE